MPKHVPQGSEEFNPFGESIGLEFTKFENGYSQCQLDVEQNLLNPYGVVHGGVICSLADTAMGGALYSCMSENERCVTVEMKVAYFHSVTSGTVNCTATVVHKSRRLGFVGAEIKSGDRVVATASGTFSIFEANAGSQ